MKKKILSVLLALTMLLSLLPVGAIAADGKTLYVDSNSGEGHYVILADAVAAASDGDTIKLSDGTFYLSGLSKDLTIEGNGANTVLYIGSSGDGNQGTGIFVENLVLSNLALNQNPTSTYTGFTGAKNLTFNNVTFSYGFSNWGNTAGRTVTFDSCKFNQTNNDLYNVQELRGNSATYYFNDCEFNSTGGRFINAYVNNGADTTLTVYVDDCTFIGTAQSKAALNLKTGYDNGCNIDLYLLGNNVTTNVAKGSKTDNPLFDDNSTHGTVYQGATKEAAVKIWENGKKVSTNFFEKDGVWHIANKAGLEEFRDNVNKGTSYAGKTISIDADIDLSGVNWESIKAYPGFYLSGTVVKGNNHTIKNMTINTPDPVSGYAYGGGFIDKTAGALTVEDLAFEGASVTSANGSQVGVVCGMSYGDVTLKNVDLKNCTVKSVTKTGAYVGQNDDGTVALTDCDLINTTVEAEYSFALMVGLLNENSKGATFTSCSADEKSKAVLTDELKEFAGSELVTIDGFTYAIDGNKLWLLNPNGAWAEQRVTGQTCDYQGTNYTVVGGGLYTGNGTVKTISEKVAATVVVGDEDDEPVEVTVEQKSEVDMTGEGVAVLENEVKTAISTNTAVSGVKLTTEAAGGEEKSGLQAVVDAAKAAAQQTGEKAAALAAAEEVKVDVTVQVKPVAYSAPTTGEEKTGAIKFELKPVAKVTAVSNQAETVIADEIEIKNEMINTAKPITVKFYTGFEPAQIIHAGDDGFMETFTEGTGDGTFSYNSTDKTCTLTIRHFSTLLALEEAKVAQVVGSDELYPSLAAAIAAVPTDGTATEIKLLSNCASGGISVHSGVNLTIDFDGKVVTFNQPGAGSTNTQTLAFQLLKGSTITFKNGTIQCADGNESLPANGDGNGKPIKRLIQNYADLTLKDMTIDGTKQQGDNSVMEFACGAVNITGTTSVKAKDGVNAFNVDTRKDAYSAGTQVTVNTTGAINGDIYCYTEADNENYSGGYTTSTLTIKNGTINGYINNEFGKVTLEGGTVNGGKRGNDAYGVRMKSTAELTVNGGTINVNAATLSASGDVYGVFPGDTSKLTVSSGSIAVTGNESKDAYAISANGNSGHNPEVKITDGSVTSNDVAIYAPSGSWTISGGTFTGKTAMYFKSNNLSITGGTFTGNGTHADYVYDGNGCNATGDALVIDSCNYPNGISDVSITGGTFTSTNAKAVAAYAYQNETPVTKFISGGTFSSEPDAGYLATEKSATKNGNVWTVGDTTYNITYKDQGGADFTGTHGANYPASYTFGTGAALVSPTKTGYTFGGWYAESTCTGSAVASIGNTDTGDKTLYAKWTINQYTISFNTNGGSTVASITQDYGTAVTAPANPTRSGYTFDGWNPAVPERMPAEDMTLTAQWDRNSSGSNTKTETTTNSDGSKTTTKTDTRTGTVTETTTAKNGTTGTVVTDKTGTVTEVKSTVSAAAVKEAAKTGEAVTLPVEVPFATDTAKAPAVEVSVPKNSGSVKVEIPVENVTPGTVAVLVLADGTEKIVSTSLVTEDGVTLTLDGSATVKVIDNSKDFADVPETNVFHDEIAALSAREIMIGKSEDSFDLYGNVTLNQIANVAGRIIGEVDVKDYDAGIDWGTENGLKTGNVAATRGDVLRALYVAAGSPVVSDTGILARFKDGIPADLTVIAAWAAQNGILQGDTAGNAKLGANVTRGQACALAGRTMITLG